jgi:hypothetical protein
MLALLSEKIHEAHDRDEKLHSVGQEPQDSADVVHVNSELRGRDGASRVSVS